MQQAELMDDDSRWSSSERSKKYEDNEATRLEDPKEELTGLKQDNSGDVGFEEGETDGKPQSPFQKKQLAGDAEQIQQKELADETPAGPPDNSIFKVEEEPKQETKQEVKMFIFKSGETPFVGTDTEAFHVEVKEHIQTRNKAPINVTG